MFERWNEIYQLMETYLALFTAIASIGSLIFVGKGFYLAKNYLAPHAKKVRLERSYSLIHNSMLKIARYVSNYHLFFKKISTPKLKYILGEISAVEAVNLIKAGYQDQFPEMNENTITSFEIDVEIKLISNERIKVLWNQLFECISELGAIYENIHTIETDEENCRNFLIDLPFGLFGTDHLIQKKFSTTYSHLMSSLLSFYRKQEEKLKTFPKIYESTKSRMNR